MTNWINTYSHVTTAYHRNRQKCLLLLLIIHYFTYFHSTLRYIVHTVQNTTATLRKPLKCTVNCKLSILTVLIVFLLIVNIVCIPAVGSTFRRTAHSEVKSTGHTHYVPLMSPKCCITVLLCSLHTDAVWQTASFSWPQTHTEPLFYVTCSPSLL